MEVISSSEQGQVKYAGFWLRLAAFIIDGFVISIAVCIVAIPIIIGIIAFGFNLKDIKGSSDFFNHGGLLLVGGIIGLIVLFHASFSTEIAANSYLLISLLQCGRMDKQF